MKIQLNAKITDSGNDAGTFEIVSGGYYEIEITNLDAEGNPVNMTDKPVAFLMRRNVKNKKNDFEFENITADNHITKLTLPSVVTLDMSGSYFFEYGFKKASGKIYRTVFGTLKFAHSGLYEAFFQAE